MNIQLFFIESRNQRSHYNQSSFQMLNLFNSSFQEELFNYIPKSFTISTKSSSCKFNIELLSNVSKTISEEINDNPSIDHYNLDITDERNVLGKFSDLLDGKEVNFDLKDLPVCNKITRTLEILSCPNFMKPVYLQERNDRNLNDYDDDDDNSTEGGVKIDKITFNKFFINKFQSPFSIITNKRKYSCNRYAVYSSHVIRKFIQNNPDAESYKYDFEDEFDEFQDISLIFNFQKVVITKSNYDSLKKIIEDLQIVCFLDQIDNFIDNYNKITDMVNDFQELIDPLDEMFELLYQIKDSGIQKVKDFIVDSIFCESEDEVRELAAIIIQVAITDFSLHLHLADLILQLDQESEKIQNLKVLKPFIVQYFLFTLGINKTNCSFTYVLYQKGIIAKNEIIDKLNEFLYASGTKDSYYYNYPHSKSRNRFDDFSYLLNFYSRESDYANRNTNIKDWFLPELFEINDKAFTDSNDFYKSEVRYIDTFLPDKIHIYKQMRDKREPLDEITIALRNDDVDKLQSILSKMPDSKSNKSLLGHRLSPSKQVLLLNNIPISGIVPYNIFEFYLPNGKTSYINYAAAHGSVKCFKYLMLNGHDIDNKTFEMAILGGNIEIIKIVDNNKNNIKTIKTHQSEYGFHSNKYSWIIPSIIKHQNDIFDWLFQEKLICNDDPRKLYKGVLDDLIIHAARNGNAHALIEIIDKGYDYSTKFDEIVNCAAVNGFYRIVQLLYDINFSNKTKKSNIRKLDYNQDRNFLYFSCFGNISIMKLYPKENIKVIDSGFVLSVIRGYKKMIEYFFENGFDIYLSCNAIIESLTKSVENKTDEIFKLLLSHFKLDFVAITNIFFHAYELNKFGIVKQLTQYFLQKYPDQDFSSVFIRFASNNCIEVCQYFIDNNVYINYDNFYSNINVLSSANENTLSLLFSFIPHQIVELFINCNLYPSIQKSNLNLIEFLLKRNAPSEYALIEAVKTNNLDVVNLVLKYKNSPAFINKSSEKGTALCISASNSNLPIFKKLLSLPGINLDLYDNQRRTPLKIAIIKSNVEIISEILDFYGDNLKFQVLQLNKAIKTFLSIVKPIICISHNDMKKKIYKHTKMIPILERILKVENVDVNSFTKNYSILTYACEFNAKSLFDILLKSDRIDANLYVPINGNTPLITALLSNSIDLAKILINNPKVDINMSNYAKSTPLIIAVENNLPDIVDLLINHEKFDPERSMLNYAFYISPPHIAKKLISNKSLNVNYIDLNMQNDDYNKNRINNVNKSFSSRSQDYWTKFSQIFYYYAIASLSGNYFNDNIDESEIDISEYSEIIDLIIHHPSFDMDKSLIKQALFDSFIMPGDQCFKKLFALCDNDFTIVDKKGHGILYNAVKHKNIEIVNFMLNNENINISPDVIFECLAESPIFSKGEEEIKKYIKRHIDQFDLSKLLQNGETPLTMSIILEKPKKDNNATDSDVIKFLIDNGANPNIPNKEGEYPLQLAIEESNLDVVSDLINSDKIDLSIKVKDFKQLDGPDQNDYHMTSYIHVAASYIGSLELLVNLNIFDINLVDDIGDTPLIKAVKSYQRKNIIFLFGFDELDFLHKNNEGKDALMIAAERFSGGNINRPHRKKDYSEQPIKDRSLYLMEIRSYI